MSLPRGLWDRHIALLQGVSDVARPVTLATVVDVSRYSTTGASFVGVRLGGATSGSVIQAVYRDGPRPALGDLLQVKRGDAAGDARWYAWPLPYAAPACGDTVMGTFVLAAGSVGVGDDLFTPGTTLATDVPCYLRTLTAFDHLARFYPRLWNATSTSGQIKVVDVPAGTPAGTCFPIEYRYGGAPSAAPIYEGQLPWDYCQLITQEPAGRYPGSPFVDVAGDAVEVRG